MNRQQAGGPLAELLAAVDTGEFEDDGWVHLTGVQWDGDDLRLALTVHTGEHEVPDEHSVAVEARDQIGHGRPAAQPGLPSRLDEGCTARHRQQRGRPADVIDAFAAAFGDALQGRLLRTTQTAQRLTLWGRHPISLPTVSGHPSSSGHLRRDPLDGNCSRHGQDHVEPDEHADLLDLAQDAIFVRDFQTRAVRYWNRGAERLYGWSAAEAIGQVSDRLLTTHFPQPLDSIQSTLETTGAWEGELVHTARDGRRIVVNSRWALRRDKTGCPAAILEVNTDITQRREADEILHEQAALLDLVPDAVLVRDFSTDRIKHSRR